MNGTVVPNGTESEQNRQAGCSLGYPRSSSFIPDLVDGPDHVQVQQLGREGQAGDDRERRARREAHRLEGHAAVPAQLLEPRHLPLHRRRLARVRLRWSCRGGRAVGGRRLGLVRRQRRRRHWSERAGLSVLVLCLSGCSGGGGDSGIRSADSFQGSRPRRPQNRSNGASSGWNRSDHNRAPVVRRRGNVL